MQAQIQALANALSSERWKTQPQWQQPPPLLTSGPAMNSTPKTPSSPPLFTSTQLFIGGVVIMFVFFVLAVVLLVQVGRTNELLGMLIGVKVSKGRQLRNTAFGDRNW
jgi:hypothetical protein